MTTVVSHADAMDETPDPEVPERAKRPRSYSARYKAEILAEYERLDKAAKGALLRREGLYTSLLSEWRKQRDRGALQALGMTSGRPPADPVERENARLRRGRGAPGQPLPPPPPEPAAAQARTGAVRSAAGAQRGRAQGGPPDPAR